jgi:HupE / UreJ protein
VRGLGVLALCLSATAVAHPLDVGYLEITGDGAKLRATLDLSVPLAADLAHLNRADLSGDGAAARAGTLVDATLRGRLTRGDAPCELAQPSAELAGASVKLLLDAACPLATGPLDWEFPFIREAPLTFRLLGKAVVDGSEREFILEAGKETLHIEGPPRASFGEFVWMGFRHIGAAPSEWWGSGGLQLAPGIDHILFLLALILAGGGLLSTLKTVTGFTAGHSVTLTLATLGWVRLPSRLTESAIALSIAFVAAEDLFRKPRHRWQVAAGFGLVHGLGFASALSALHLGRSQLASALIGFNVGVELGQAMILVLLSPFIYLLFHQALLKRYAVPTLAAGIALCGAFWFVQRAFF